MSQNIKKITFYLFLLRVLRTFLSVITLTFSAKYFGVSLERDVWILVTTFLTTLGAAVWGPINETFRAKFVFIKEEEGEAIAILKTSSLLGFVLIITLFLSIIAYIFSDNIASFMTTKLIGNGNSLFVLILIILIPTFVINQLTSLGISILNAYDVYYVPEIIGSITGVLNLLIIILLAPSIGIYSLAVSQYVSIVLLLLVVLYQIKKIGINIWKSGTKIHLSHVKCFLLFSLPFFFPYFIGQCNILAEKWIAGLLGTGSVSSLDYARQFTLVLQGVLSSVLATVMVPMLAKAFSRQDTSSYLSILRENIVVCFAIMSLTIPILFGAAQPLCDFFFLRGSITVNTVNHIVILTRLYAVAFIGVSLYLVFGMSLLSSKKGKQYAFWGVMTQILVLIINLSFYSTLETYIFPISLGIGHFLSAIIMSVLLDVHHKRSLYFDLLKYISVVIVISFIIYSFNMLVLLDSFFAQLALNFVLLLLLLPAIAKGLGYSLRPYLQKIFK